MVFESQDDIGVQGLDGLRPRFKALLDHEAFGSPGASHSVSLTHRLLVGTMYNTLGDLKEVV